MRLLVNKSSADEIVAEENYKKMETDLQVIVGKLTAEDVETSEVLKAFKWNELLWNHFYRDFYDCTDGVMR